MDYNKVGTKHEYFSSPITFNDGDLSDYLDIICIACGDNKVDLRALTWFDKAGSSVKTVGIHEVCAMEPGGWDGYKSES